MKVYLAGGWFNEVQDREISTLERVINEQKWLTLRSPRLIFVAPPDAPPEVKEQTFRGNLLEIKTCGFVLANTRDKDIGTIWECGYAHACNIPIVYFAAGLEGKFNLMLAQSGLKVCQDFKELEDWLDRCGEAGRLIHEAYEGTII